MALYKAKIPLEIAAKMPPHNVWEGGRLQSNIESCLAGRLARRLEPYLPGRHNPLLYSRGVRLLRCGILASIVSFVVDGAFDRRQIAPWRAIPGDLTP